MLFELAKRFPEDPSKWDIAHPARAIEQRFRSHIRRRFGALQTAQDRSRPRAPDRLGISVRPYEAGDPVRTLAASHLFKTDELQTRTDFAPGRRSALVLVHLYENMQFASNDAPAAKGRVALALAGLIQSIHESLGQSCRIMPIPQRDFDKALVSATSRSRRANQLYLISDLLFDDSSMDASINRLQSACLEAKFSSGYLFVVRDPLEHPDENRLGDRSANLRPFTNSGTTTNLDLFSGLQYTGNLRNQRDTAASAAESLGLAFSFMSGEDPMDCVLENIEQFLNGPMGGAR